jgi:serine/threonine-protein kinase RsbW
VTVPIDPASAVATEPSEMPYREPADLAVVREFVCAHAVALGLPAPRAEVLTLAVSELATNTLQHATGGGLVRVWAQDDAVVCDVLDQGPLRSLGRAMPSADAIRGRGLAIVERLCDEVTVESEANRTRVRLKLRRRLR